MGTTLAILALAFPFVLIGAAFLLVRWMFADHSDLEAKAISDASRKSFFGTIRRWFRRPVHKLDYRRDKKGRFRKIRRG